MIAIRRLVYGPSGLRAAWRLAIFFAIAEPLIKATNPLAAWMLPARAALERASGNDDGVMYVIREALRFLVLILATWVMGRLEGRTLSDYGLPWRGSFGRRFWQGAVLGFGTLTVLLLLMRAAGAVDIGHSQLRGAEIAVWAVAWGGFFILVGLYEEFGSRGYLLYTLTQGIGFWPAAVATALFFGYSHLGNRGEDYIGLANVVGFGLLGCLLIRRTGSLWMAIGLHTAFDWGETYFYGVANSGAQLPNHLLAGTPMGPGWLSGGTVGPEGSVIATGVLVIGWFLCARWLPEVKYPTAHSGADLQRSLNP